MASGATSSNPLQNIRSYWQYVPAQGAPIVFAVLFAISGVLHIWQNNFKYRSWRIGFLLPWAAALFVSGFALREVGVYQPANRNIFIASQVLLFCAPPVYAGANYFIFGRLLYYIPYLSPMHPGRVWTTFIALDGVVEALAGNGASKALNPSLPKTEIKVGIGLVKASLILQLALFVAFVWLIVIFHRRCVRAKVISHRVKIVIYELYATSCLILLRNTFRTATFFLKFDSYTNRTEWTVWVFEFVPMVMVSWLYNVYPPAKYLPANHKIYLAKDGKTELIGPGHVDKRPFIVTLIDPFDIAGLVTGKDQKNRFWEEDGVGGPKKAEQS